MRIKLSSVASDLLSVGLCILWALARGEGDPKKLAALGEERLRHREEQLIDALAGSPQPMHRELLSLQLERLQLLHEQIARLNGMIAQATSWVGTCSGKEESAEENHNSRSAKGNRYLRRVLNQAATLRRQVGRHHETRPNPESLSAKKRTSELLTCPL